MFTSQAVDYATESRDLALASSPLKRAVAGYEEADPEDDSDTDFQEEKAMSEAEESGNETDVVVDVGELQPTEDRRGSRSVYASQAAPSQRTSLFAAVGDWCSY